MSALIQETAEQEQRVERLTAGARRGHESSRLREITQLQQRLHSFRTRLREIRAQRPPRVDCIEKSEHRRAAATSGIRTQVEQGIQKRIHPPHAIKPGWRAANCSRAA